MDIEELPLADLVQDPANVRRHDAKNIEAIKGSLARFGQQKPIVVDAHNVVIAGNGTVAALRELGLPTVRVVRSELQGSDRTAYAIADNRSGELAEWDNESLAEQLSALAIEDNELLAATGFDEAELERLVDAATELSGKDADASPQLGGLEYRVIVSCTDELHQREVLVMLEGLGLECRALIS